MIFRALMAGLLAAALSAPLVLAQGRDLPDVDARPVRPPAPVYPQAAAVAGLSGYCEVRFNVDTQGKPSNIRPLCSHPEFCASAAAALEAVRFMPARRDGKIVARENVFYPLEYLINDAPQFDRKLTVLEECVDPLIS